MYYNFFKILVNNNWQYCFNIFCYNKFFIFSSLYMKIRNKINAITLVL